MARIAWHGIGPWHKTAYGLLAGTFTRHIRDLGHEVVLCLMGQRGDHHPLRHPDALETARTGLWDGMKVIGPGLTEFGMPPPAEVRAAFGGHDPDLVIVLKDAWVLDHARPRWQTAVWCNIDCEPMGAQDAAYFRSSGAVPIATSRFGLKMMQDAGLSSARYIPHGIDLDQWQPGDQGEARDLLGLPRGAFIAGIDAANMGYRKAFGEQMGAFAEEVRRGRRDSLLLVNAYPDCPPGVDPALFEGMSLRELAASLNISDHVKFPSHHNMSHAQMLTWYRALDVLMAASYGEGFGMPIVQALAVGVPVIGTRCSAITEKIPPGAGWLVPGQRWWNPPHQAYWTIPSERSIAAQLGKQGNKAVMASVASQYDAGMITREFWKPLIEELCHARA